MNRQLTQRSFMTIAATALLSACSHGTGTVPPLAPLAPPRAAQAVAYPLRAAGAVRRVRSTSAAAHCGTVVTQAFGTLTYAVRGTRFDHATVDATGCDVGIFIGAGDGENDGGAIVDHASVANAGFAGILVADGVDAVSIDHTTVSATGGGAGAASAGVAIDGATNVVVAHTDIGSYQRYGFLAEAGASFTLDHVSATGPGAVTSGAQAGFAVAGATQLGNAHPSSSANQGSGAAPAFLVPSGGGAARSWGYFYCAAVDGAGQPLSAVGDHPKSSSNSGDVALSATCPAARPVPPAIPFMTEFDYTAVPGAGNFDIFTGPDGSLWSYATNTTLARIDPGSGAQIAGFMGIGMQLRDVTQPMLQARTRASDGSVWMQSYAENDPTPYVTRITAFGQSTTYAMPAPWAAGCAISGLAAGKNGSVYVTSRNSGRLPFCWDTHGSVLAVDPAGNFTQLGLNDANKGGRNIYAATSDAAGTLYFAGRICCDTNGYRFFVSRLNPDDTVSDVQVPQTPRQPGTDNAYDVADVTLGPDGKVWYLRSAAGTIGRVDVTTAAVTEYTPPTANGGPYFAAVGSDGNLWFSESTNHAVARMRFAGGAATGVIDEYPLPGNAVPSMLTAHANGTLWVVADIEKVIRIDPRQAP